MDNGYRGIRPLGLLQHDIGNGFSHNVRTAHHHDLGAVSCKTGPDDELLNAGRGAGQIPRLFSADHEAAHIDRMEAVHILVRVNGI